MKSYYTKIGHFLVDLVVPNSDADAIIPTKRRVIRQPSFEQSS